MDIRFMSDLDRTPDPHPHLQHVDLRVFLEQDTLAVCVTNLTDTTLRLLEVRWEGRTGRLSDPNGNVERGFGMGNLVGSHDLQPGSLATFYLHPEARLSVMNQALALGDQRFCVRVYAESQEIGQIPRAELIPIIRQLAFKLRE